MSGVDEIGAGAEALARAGDHQHAVVAVGRHLVEHVAQPAPHRAGDRVELVGTVERERHDTVASLDEEVVDIGRYRSGVGLNPFRSQAKRGTDVVIVVVALVVVAALVLWAVFG